MEIKVDKLDGGRLLANTGFTATLSANGIDSAEDLWGLEGTTVKKVVRERGTERVVLNDGGRKLEAFIKRYNPPPLGERLKCLFSGKKGDYDALDEWNALLSFHRLGLKTMTPIAAAKLEDGRSCDLTLSLGEHQRASVFFTESTAAERRLEIAGKIGAYAGKMHAAEHAHQDLYLVHFFILPGDEINLIDLQRVVPPSGFAERWLIKDLAQLIFSADPWWNEGEQNAFQKAYAEKFGRDIRGDDKLWRRINAKAERIKRRDLKKQKQGD